ncbi:phosphatase PAP2 family protein [Bradyrhizobium sp. NFR13]|uniref:phosphatase PAP2 family protein n=1 Tax=Bradyrhizobium sp. NFR13 TaxID=1566285 RepID=UPI00336BDE91
MAFHVPANVKMPCHPATRSTWAHWHPLPARCRPAPRCALRTLAIGLSLTRVVVPAHWASDVGAGFALGAILERAVRLWAGYPGEASTEDDHANP